MHDYDSLIGVLIFLIVGDIHGIVNIKTRWSKQENENNMKMGRKKSAHNIIAWTDLFQITAQNISWGRFCTLLAREHQRHIHSRLRLACRRITIFNRGRDWWNCFNIKTRWSKQKNENNMKMGLCRRLIYGFWIVYSTAFDIFSLTILFITRHYSYWIKIW